MSTSYPSNIDNFPTPGQYLSSNPHSSLHKNVDDAVTALETKVGVDNSAVISTIDYLLKNIASIDPGHKHSFASLTGFSITSPAVGDILRYNGSEFVNFSGLQKFGGTGSDGSLILTSGTTTINCANAPVVVKNYTLLSITNTAILAFSNPGPKGTIVILKCQGNVILTSSSAPMINMSSMGAQSNSVAGFALQQFVTTAANNATGGTGNSFYAGINGKSIPVFTGGSGASKTGAGGFGGGGLYIECGGSLNFTTASGISVAGASGASTSTSGKGGGGGGGGGACVVLYNSLTANSGTITITGGSGGNGANSGGGSGAGGAGGNATTGGNGNGGTGGSASGGAENGGGGGASAYAAADGTNGQNGGGGSTQGGGGGGGGSGFSLVTLNTEFA